MPMVAIIAGALSIVAGPAPVAAGVPALRDFTWHPLLPAPDGSALGTHGPRAARTVALLQMGIPGDAPRHLTVFQVDCVADRVTSIRGYAVDSTLTRITGDAAPYGMEPQAAALAKGRPMSLAMVAEAPAGALAQLACDDTRMNTVPTAPLSAMIGGASHIDDEQDRK
ncbi:hypothetical protein [Sphingomonas endophytica]|nr:hypothetical protein [Sphingomonas endophytica]